jgi:hypothetical protein
MKTKVTYPEKAYKAKAILIAVMISIQAAVIAGDSSNVKKDYNSGMVYKTSTEASSTQSASNASLYSDEVAFEPEYEIEEWMSNIQNNYKPTCAVEEEIELEEWMCNIHNSFWKDADEVDEPELAIEDWMTQPDEWFDNAQELMLTAK